MRIEFDEQKHEYRVDGRKVPSVTDIITPLTAKHYGDIAKEILLAAAERGTVVHEACEYLDYGCTAEVPAEYEGYVQAYADFLNDFRPELLAAEKMVYSAEGDYAGRLDRWFLMDGKTAVLDIKTTSSPNRANYMAGCCQTIAYADAVGDVKRRFLLYLKKEGRYRLIDCAEWERKHNFDARRVWQLCLDLYNETERSVK